MTSDKRCVDGSAGTVFGGPGSGVVFCSGAHRMFIWCRHSLVAGPLPLKGPSAFSFLLEFKVHYFSKRYFDHVLHPSEDIYKREEERARSGPFTVRWRKMNDMICVIC